MQKDLIQNIKITCNTVTARIQKKTIEFSAFFHIQTYYKAKYQIKPKVLNKFSGTSYALPNIKLMTKIFN